MVLRSVIIACIIILAIAGIIGFVICNADPCGVGYKYATTDTGSVCCPENTYMPKCTPIDAISDISCDYTLWVSFFVMMCISLGSISIGIAICAIIWLCG